MHLLVLGAFWPALALARVCLLEVLMCLLGWMFSDNMAADVTVEGNLS